MLAALEFAQSPIYMGPQSAYPYGPYKGPTRASQGPYNDV